jgi:hypothetical protein
VIPLRWVPLPHQLFFKVETLSFPLTATTMKIQVSQVTRLKEHSPGQEGLGRFFLEPVIQAVVALSIEERTNSNS